VSESDGELNVLFDVKPDEEELAAFLRKLEPGERVYYRDWRGGKGEGVFLRHIDKIGQIVGKSSLSYWGNNRADGVVIKRDFSADDGRIFKPFLGDGDVVMSMLQIAEEVMSS
jgi:hypothetical protein